MVMQATMLAGLPVPQVHAAGTWRNHPALLLSWLPGWPVTDELRMRPWRAWQLGALFGRMHAAIHTLQAPGILQNHPDAWIDWLGPDEQSLQECLRSIDHRVDVLLHLDYHPLNVLTDGKSITGILDWRNARAGDPRADAGPCSYSPLGHEVERVCTVHLRRTEKSMSRCIVGIHASRSSSCWKVTLYTELSLQPFHGIFAP